MSYTPAPFQSQPASYASPAPPTQATSYSATPPPPPPKPSGPSTPANANRGPPLPPPPPQSQHGSSELDAGQGQYYEQQQAPQQQYQVPPIEQGWIPESLKDKSTADLQQLLQNPTLLSALLANPSTTHPSIPASQVPLAPLLNQNLTLTAHLSSLESTLTARRQHLQSRLLSLRALEQSHRTKISETETALKDFSPMALYQRLNSGVTEQQQLLRGLEESWLEEGGKAGEREVGDFVRGVKEGAKVWFLRRERKNRWDEGRVGGWR